MNPLPLRANGRKVLRRFGPFVKAKVRIKITHHEAIIRDLRLTLKGEEREG